METSSREDEEEAANRPASDASPPAGNMVEDNAKQAEGSASEESAQDVPMPATQEEDTSTPIELGESRFSSSAGSDDDADIQSDEDNDSDIGQGSGGDGGSEDDDFVEVSPAGESSSSPPPEPDQIQDTASAGSMQQQTKPDLLENVAKRLLGHPNQAKSPQRGGDFLKQVRKDFTDASGDIATSASALRASIQSSLQSSPKVARKDMSGDTEKVKENKKRVADTSISASTTFGAPALIPSLTSDSVPKTSAPATSDAPTASSAATSAPAPTPATSSVIKPTLMASQSTEHAHSFHEHTYKQPTYCGVCKGLLVGLWSQGFKCKICDMDVHRGGGAGDHDDCRSEALLAPCPRPDHDAADVKEKKAKESAKLSDVVSQIRALAENPNFIKELSEQVDRDLKAFAKDVIVEVAVDDERNKNLRRLKEALVPFVAKLDAMVANGELYVFVVLMAILALATIVQTVISFGLFVTALGPRHGFLSPTSFQLAAMHDATVTAALHTVLAVVSAIGFYLASIFKRKQNLIDRFLQDAFRINAANDVGIGVADTAQRLMSWSKRLLASTLLSMLVSFFFWHQSQPVSWAAAKLPPMANILIPAFVFTLCAGAVTYFSYANAPPDVALEEYVDVKSEMIQAEIDIAATKRAESEGKWPALAEEVSEQDPALNDIDKTKAMNGAELHDLLDELVPSGAII